MSNRRKVQDIGLADDIDVIYPSPDPPHEPLTDHVPRAEFLQRMSGTGAAEQLQQAGRQVRVIALMDADALYRWLTTRGVGHN